MSFNKLARIIVLLALGALLQGCGAVKLVYNQAPQASYWYLDDYLDFTDAQRPGVKDALQKIQQWHRQTQLGGYVEALHQLQKQAPLDITSEQICEVYADVRHKLLAVATRMEPVIFEIIPTLKPEQLTHLEHKFEKINAKFRDEFMEGSPRSLHGKRLKLAVKRAENLYGSLAERQRELLKTRLNSSSFNAAMAYTERLRRQNDALQTLRTLGLR